MNNRLKMSNEILNDFKTNGYLDVIKDKQLHLGIFTEPYLDLMIEGKKTIESRFNKKKIVPYKAITKDDIVIVKKSGGKVIGFLEIEDVIFFDLTYTPIEEVKLKYGKKLCVDETFWNIKKDSKYATLIFIKKFYLVDSFPISKKGMQTWIVL